MRVFIPLSIITFLIGFILILFRIIIGGQFLVTSIIFMFFATNFLFLGLIADLINKKISLNEPYLDDMLVQYYNNITFTSDASLISNCNIVYLTQDVPTDNYGKSDLTIINKYLGD